MRKTNDTFSTGERKVAMWVVIVVALIMAGATARDRLAGPSLGSYADGYQAQALPGVLDATPLS